MKLLSTLLIAALGAACATTDGADEVTQASSTGATCADPTAYGAILNDNADDTVPIRAAICAALCPSPPAGCGACNDPSLPGYGSHAVCLPAGELDAIRPVATPTVFQSFDIAGVNRLTIYGEGPASVLAMHGPGAVPCSNSCSGTTCTFADWKLFAIHAGSQHIEFRDLTLTSTGVDGFDKDSTRFIEFGDQVSNTDDLLIKNTRMINACGDHVFLIGGGTDPGTSARGVRILDSTLGNAVRRGVVVKHGVRRAVFSHNTFDTSGGAIDFDPSATEAPATELVITDNSFRSTSAYSLNLSGESADSHLPASSVVFANNVLFGPAISGGVLQSVEIRNNTIFNSIGVADINFSIGSSDHLDISHNTFVRGATTGAAILVTARDRPSPNLRVAGNTIVQPSQEPAIDVIDVVDHVIANNVIAMTWSDAAHPAAAGIRTGTALFDVASSQVSGNAITGVGDALSTGITVNLTSSVCSVPLPPSGCDVPQQMHFGSLQANRNLVVGARSGILIGVGRTSTNKPKGLMTQLPMIANNDLTVSSASSVDISGSACGASPGCLPPAYVIGGNQGSVVQLVGTGDPTANNVAAPNGSIYMMRGGTASGSAALFFRENNTWVAQ